MKRIISVSAVILLMSIFQGCAGTSELRNKEVSSLSRPSTHTILNISDSLPQSGLWRQNIVLADMNDDGFLDIVAPPPRKGKKGEERPFIFLWDNKDGKWKEGQFSFPGEKYDYGGIAVGDLYGGGCCDMVLAVHSGKVLLLENDGKKSFSGRPLLPERPLFHSRAVEVADVNSDGRPDIIALSESPFDKDYTRQGLLVALNKGDKSWDTKILNESGGLSGDFFAVGDLKGNGNKDIVICEENGASKLVWFGDGKGNFTVYDNKFIGDTWPHLTRVGDIDGDKKDEVVFNLMSRDGKLHLAAFKWSGEAFENISAGIASLDDPISFDLFDVDGDGRKDLVVLTGKGIGIYKYVSHKWVQEEFYPISSPADAEGAYELKVVRNGDGSILIAYDLGAFKSHGMEINHGLRAYLLK